MTTPFGSFTVTSLMSGVRGVLLKDACARGSNPLEAISTSGELSRTACGPEIASPPGVGPLR